MESCKRVFITGATGFVGSAVLKELATQGFAINALIRDDRALTPGATPIQGDLFDPEALDRGMKDCFAAIHLVGVIMENPSAGVTFERIHIEGTRAVVEAAQRNNIARFIHMSALGTRPDAPSRYHRTKFAGERLVMAAGIPWTIFRPSMIHGPDGEFMKMEAKFARKHAPPWLFMPYFGKGLFGFGGAGKLQPVSVNEVARAFVAALSNEKSIGEIYPLAGSQVITWPELHQIVAQAVVGHRRWVMPIPAWKAKMLTYIAPASLLPFNRDQVLMAGEDNTADVTRFVKDFGWTPGAFSEQIKEYAGRM